MGSVESDGWRGDVLISLTVNGRRRELDGPTSLIDFLGSLGLDLRFVAVAYNGQVLERDSFASVTLDDGDEVEIVRPVGGG